MLSAALKLKPTEPAPLPVLSVPATLVVSAVPSTLASPLGSVVSVPPAQVAVASALATVCVLFRSTSVKASVPVAVSLLVEPVRPVCSVIAPVCALEVITGASLVPVIVKVTGLVLVALPSLTVTL